MANSSDALFSDRATEDDTPTIGEMPVVKPEARSPHKAEDVPNLLASVKMANTYY